MVARGGQSATRRGGRGGGDRLDDEGEAGEAWSGAGVGQPDGVDMAPPRRRRCRVRFGDELGKKQRQVYIEQRPLVPVPTTNRD